MVIILLSATFTISTRYATITSFKLIIQQFYQHSKRQTCIKFLEAKQQKNTRYACSVSEWHVGIHKINVRKSRFRFISCELSLWVQLLICKQPNFCFASESIATHIGKYSFGVCRNCAASVLTESNDKIVKPHKIKHCANEKNANKYSNLLSII